MSLPEPAPSSRPPSPVSTRSFTQAHAQIHARAASRWYMQVKAPGAFFDADTHPPPPSSSTCGPPAKRPRLSMEDHQHGQGHPHHQHGQGHPDHQQEARVNGEAFANIHIINMGKDIQIPDHIQIPTLPSSGDPFFCFLHGPALDPDDIKRQCVALGHVRGDLLIINEVPENINIEANPKITDSIVHACTPPGSPPTSPRPSGPHDLFVSVPPGTQFQKVVIMPASENPKTPPNAHHGHPWYDASLWNVPPHQISEAFVKASTPPGSPPSSPSPASTLRLPGSPAIELTRTIGHPLYDA